METLTPRVLCVKQGTKYGPEWVHRLHKMVARHLGSDFDFVCLTDEPMFGIRCEPLTRDLPGWWAKINLFEPGRFPGVNIYFDLDVVITQYIGAIEMTSGKLNAFDDFSYSLLNPRRGMGDAQRRLLGGNGTINSSVMAWCDDDARAVWDNFTDEKMIEVHGDQNWITQALWPDGIKLIDPKWVCSYKYHVMRGEPARAIVVFHGDPKVDKLPHDDPLYQMWEAA